MLDIRNHTPFQNGMSVYIDVNGAEHFIIVLKATYQISGNGNDLAVLHTEQVPIHSSPEYHGAHPSSLKFDTDLHPPSPETGVFVVGSAWAENDSGYVDTGIEINGNPYIVRVFGERRWYKRLTGWNISDPQAFETISLQFENSFGGWDLSAKDPKHHAFEERNPLGRGYYARKTAGPSEGDFLPSIENPCNLIKSWRDKPSPVSFGVIGPDWSPRKEYAGTYNQEWDQNQKPYLPLDFDQRFFISSMVQIRQPSDSPIHLSLWNIYPFRFQQVKIPIVECAIDVLIRNKTQTHPFKLDSITVDAEKKIIEVNWKATFPCTRALWHIQSIETRVCA